MAGLGLQEEYKSTMTGGLAPQAEQQLAQTAARQRFGGNKNFGDVARNQQLQTQLAASHKEQSDRLFRYKELAQRKDMAAEAQRQFDVSTKQQATQFEEQKAFEYAQQRRSNEGDWMNRIFGK
jgi:hypothetical protein